jgi:hypothetical protein
MSIPIATPRATASVRFVVAALFLALAAPAAAAEFDGRRGGEGCFSIGWTRIDVGPLNDVLQPLGYERLGANALSLGGSGHSFIGRLLIGGQGHGLLTGGRDANLLVGPFRTRLHQGYGFFDIGWVAVRTGEMELAPLLGIGGGATQLTITDRATAPFGDVARDPRRSSRLTRSAFLLDLGAALTRFIPLGDSPRGTHGLVVGVRAGYVLAPAEGEWRDGDVELVGGPDSGLAGPYVRILFGGRGQR